VRLLAGLPALGACEPALGILLAADRPLTSWPAVLRSARSSYRLELGADRPGLPPLLAAALIESGFLPRA
jgi:hypothetical protein